METEMARRNSSLANEKSFLRADVLGDRVRPWQLNMKPTQ